MLNVTLKVKVDGPRNNRDLNQGVLHLWSKFGDLSLTGPKLLRGQASDWYTHTDTQTDAGNTIPEGQNWPRVKIQIVDNYDIVDIFVGINRLLP